jgi:hypothetical protein
MKADLGDTQHTVHIFAFHFDPDGAGGLQVQEQFKSQDAQRANKGHQRAWSR